MNVKRGLIRLWVLSSAVWCLSLLALAAQEWYHAASYWYRSRGIEVTPCKPWELNWRQNAPIKPPPPGFTLDPPQPQTSPPTAQPDCFHVTTRDGSQYLVDVKKGSWNNDSIKDVVFYNPDLFPILADPKTQSLSRVDLTNGDPRLGSRYLVIGNSHDHPDLGFTMLLTSLAFLIPITILALGWAMWWVARGFR
jgi:hypothetical protein